MPILDAVRRARNARAASRAASGASSRPPVLSVVLPIYNVEAYLETTLASVAAQSLREFEVVIVDDGSPDSSADIARAWAARDRRFRVVSQENAGPSAARNTGIRHCTAPYLTFVDGDDTLPPDAWKHLVGALERTGSDLSVGKLVRDNGRRQFATERMERNHVEDRGRAAHPGDAADPGRRLPGQQGLPADVLGRPRPGLPRRDCSTRTSPS